MPVIVSLRADQVQVADVPAFMRAMRQAGAAAVGVNCAHGPAGLRDVVRAMAAVP